jgi:hypothetical protein
VTSIKLFNAIIAPMNRELKNSSKVKISRYHLDRIIEVFIKKRTIESVKVNKNTARRYIKEIRKSVIKSEDARFLKHIDYIKPVVRIVYPYEDEHDDTNSLEFHLFIISKKHIYILNSTDDFFKDIATVVLKEDCFKERYISSLEHKIGKTAKDYLLQLCNYTKNQVRLYPSTLYDNLVEMAFYNNVKADNSILDVKYMKDIFREFPLFK